MIRLDEEHPWKGCKTVMPFRGFESRRFLTSNQEMDNAEKDLGLMFTDKWYKKYDYLPESKRFFIFFFGLGLPIVLLNAWNVFIGVPIFAIILFDRYRFLRKHGAL